jgi:hypothetical protein
LSGYDVDIAAVSGIFMKNAQRVMESVVSDDAKIETPARQGGLYATLRDRFRL